MVTGNSASDVDVRIAGAAEAVPRMLEASWSSGVDLAWTLHTTMNDLHLSFLELLGAQIERNAVLFTRLGECRNADDMVDLFTAHAAATLADGESRLSKMFDTGVRINGRAMSAMLRPALAARL